MGPSRLWAIQPTKLLPRRVDRHVDERAARAVTRAAAKLGFTDPLLWVNDPAGASAVEMTGWRALYDITDDWLEAERTPAEHERLVRDEATLMRLCKEVVVCSPSLARTKGSIRPVTLIPNAVDVDAYRRLRARPRDLPSGPVALYVGTVHTDRIDLDLCVATASAIRGRGCLVLLGPAPLSPSDDERLAKAGVILLGAKDRDDVPAYLQHADVLVVPHVLTPFTESLDPIKLYEYRVVGRPVVSTPVAGFRDLADRGVVVSSGREFVADVARFLPAPWAFPEHVANDVPTWRERISRMGEVLSRVSQ